VPIGYWNDGRADDAGGSRADVTARKTSTGQMIAGIRRRGC